MLVPITAKCNNRCISCIRLHSESDAVNINLDFIKKKFSGIKNISNICINGGEPTLHKEFLMIIKYIGSKFDKSDILLLSNCRMFSKKENVAKLRKLKINNLRIGATIYGHTDKLHQSITRTPKSFNQTTQGVINLIESGFGVELRVVINKINYTYLDEISSYIISKFKGCERVALINMKIAGEAFKNRKQLLVRYTNVIPFALKAVDALQYNGFKVALFHFPLCILPKSAYKNNWGPTINQEDLEYAKCCQTCSQKKNCSGIWKNYKDEYGESEFKSIK